MLNRGLKAASRMAAKKLASNAKIGLKPEHDHAKWVPVRAGAIYCSPRCGANCTYAAFERATKAANRLAKRLNRKLGPGWRPVVWENLGWHYKVAKGKGVGHFEAVVEVHEYRHTIGAPTYDAWIQSEPQHIVSGFRTPEEAVIDALRQQTRHVQAQLKTMRAVLK